MKFMKYYIENEGKKHKVWYSLDNRVDGKTAVTVYASDYGVHLGFLPTCENDSDSQTDYFMKDRATFFEDTPLYAEVRARAEKNEAERKAKSDTKPTARRERITAKGKT